MKVLISAMACDPYLVSENYVGWAAVKALAKDHEIWVMTGRRNQSNLQRAVTEGRVPHGVRFVYAGRFREWHPNRTIARLQSWAEYLSFTNELLPLAHKLHAQESFDAVHHVTFATWRVASPLWKLGIPFIFGPVGGNTIVPLQMFSLLSPAAIGFEVLRNSSALIARLSPAIRAGARHAAHVFTTDAETGALMKKLRRATDGVSTLSQAFFTAETIRSFTRIDSIRTPAGPLRIFAGGNLIGAKGVALALQALARAKAAGVQFRYRVGSGGPELVHLQNMVRQLGLEHEVLFGEQLRGTDYEQELAESHIYLLPSLQESAGLTMMEAMLAGAVPVVAQCGGPATIVTEECGYKVPVTSQETMIRHLTETIVYLEKNRGVLLSKGKAASHRIATLYSEDNYRTTVNAVYRSAIATFRNHSSGDQTATVHE